MPKQRITKQDVLNAAYELAKRGGAQAVMVKAIARELNCSVQPIYSYCENMDALRCELAQMAGGDLTAFVKQNIIKGDEFRTTGLAYLKFAKLEPELFKLYFSRKRTSAKSLDEIYNGEASPQMPALIASGLNISEEKARRLHLNMIIYNMGLSFILTNGGEDIDENELQEMLFSAYDTFLNKIQGDI